MRVETYEAPKTLLTIIAEDMRRGKEISEGLKRCNAWQKERMEAEKIVFGTSLTRELSEEELRNARVYINGVTKWD